MNPPLRITDIELPEQLRLKSREGAEALHDQYAKVLRFAIFRIVQQKDLTDRLLEKAICKIWNDIDYYNEQKIPLLAWMLVIAKKLAKDANTPHKEIVKRLNFCL